jgi:hypothetical protein
MLPEMEATNRVPGAGIWLHCEQGITASPCRKAEVEINAKWTGLYEWLLKQRR